MKRADTFGFVADDQRALARRILGGDSGRAVVGVARLGLNASKRKHETAARIAPVGTKRHDAGNVEGGGDLAGRAKPDVLPQISPYQRVMDEIQRIPHGHPDMIDELQRRRPGTALGPVDDNENGHNAGLHHRLADTEKFPWMADTELETDRLAVR